MLLRKRGLEIAAKKGDPRAREGRIEAYVHPGNKIGVLLEVNCETDFVARNSDFMQFTRDYPYRLLHVAPCISRRGCPGRCYFRKGIRRLLQGALFAFTAFVKDPSITIQDYLGGIVAKIGENIVVRRFVRYKIGE